MSSFMFLVSMHKCNLKITRLSFFTTWPGDCVRQKHAFHSLNVFGPRKKYYFLLLSRVLWRFSFHHNHVAPVKTHHFFFFCQFLLLVDRPRNYRYEP